MAKYLDETGLAHFWGNIKPNLYDSGSYGIDIRDSVVHDLQLGSGIAFQAMTVIDGVIYYTTVDNNTDIGYLYSVPADFSDDPTLLLQLAGLHAYSMGSLNKHTLLITYSGNFMLYNINTGTYTTKTMTMLWGFCCDRKTDDDSLLPDLFVGFDSCNNGIYRYGHTPNGVYQPSFTIPTSHVGGHLQDTAANGYWCFELLVGVPGIASNGNNLPYRNNYLYVFNANTSNPLCCVPIICNWEIEGISVPSFSSTGVADMWLADVSGKFYHVSAKLQPSSLGALFAGEMKQPPLARFNTNSFKRETVNDSNGASYNLITEIYLPHTFPVAYGNHYQVAVVNGGAKCKLYVGDRNLDMMYTLSTNGTYMAYNKVSGTEYTFQLASISNSGTNINATYNSSTNTLNKTFGNLRITGNSLVTNISDAYSVPDISFA